MWPGSQYQNTIPEARVVGGLLNCNNYPKNCITFPYDNEVCIMYYNHSHPPFVLCHRLKLQYQGFTKKMSSRISNWPKFYTFSGVDGY